MLPETVVITDCDITTAYGRGIGRCWDGVMSGATAIRPCGRFNTDRFQARIAATVDGITYDGGDSLVMQMLEPLFVSLSGSIPSDAFVMLATTIGEIDLLERSLIQGSGNVAQSMPAILLEKIISRSATFQSGMVISAACASASVAIGRAASMIRNGERECVVVIACDSVSEFAFSGFSSLMALDAEPARPFDAHRAGLSLGEAAGIMVLMSERRAQQEHRTVLGRVCGWGYSCDANHMTGPSRDGAGLAMAVTKALASARIDASDIGSICAHGTGTPYNDAMEMMAFKKIFASPVPVYSIKGATGHTMAAAGLIEAAVGLAAAKQKCVPATVGLREVDAIASDWAHAHPVPCEDGYALSVNAGFGGVNAALVMKVL